MGLIGGIAAAVPAGFVVTNHLLDTESAASQADNEAPPRLKNTAVSERKLTQAEEKVLMDKYGGMSLGDLTVVERKFTEKITELGRLAGDLSGKIWAIDEADRLKKPLYKDTERERLVTDEDRDEGRRFKKVLGETDAELALRRVQLKWLQAYSRNRGGGSVARQGWVTTLKKGE